MYNTINSKFKDKKFKQVYEHKSTINDFKDKNKMLNIYSWNVNSLHACLFKRNDGNDFKKFIDNESPDILLFNETKLNDIRATECKTCLSEKYKFKFIHFNNSVTKKG